MEIKWKCQECGAIAQIKEWNMNYYVYLLYSVSIQKLLHLCVSLHHVLIVCNNA
mgnify:CR=1 FL=1